MRKLLPVLLVGGLLHVAPIAAEAQQLCSASTAPTVRNPGYPSSTPYSNATSRVTSNCTGPSVDLNIQPDPFYGLAFIPAYQADPTAGQVDPYAYARLSGATPLTGGAAGGYAANPYTYDPYAATPYAYNPYAADPAAVPPSAYVPSGAPGAYAPYAYGPYGYLPYGYAPYLSPAVGALCGPGGCGDLGNLGWGQIVQPYPTPWGPTQPAPPGYAPYPYWGPR
ncbi:MAG: hypothetical protein IRZ14_02900 [Chloroflexi bacterium]|nr:hypothetical protein [Chloroflexota bacterium]